MGYRRLILAALACALAVPVAAQIGSRSVRTISAAPSGACNIEGDVRVVDQGDDIGKTYCCNPSTETWEQCDITGAVSDPLDIDTFRSKLRPWIDVTHEDYGAVPDDAADDTAAFQAAINAWEDGGGTLFCPPGTYNINTSPGLVVTPTVNWRSTHEFRGYGCNLVSGLSGSDWVLSFDNSGEKSWENLSIVGIEITGGPASGGQLRIDGGPASAAGAFLWKFNVRDVRLTDSDGGGMKVEGSAFEFVLDNVKVDLDSANITGIGIFIEDNDATSDAVSSCYLVDLNTRYGLRGLEINNTDCHLRGGTFLEADDECIRWESAFGGEIVGPHVENCHAGGADTGGLGGLNIVGPATAVGVRCTASNSNMTRCIGTFSTTGTVINVIGGTSGGDVATDLYVRNNATGYTVNAIGVDVIVEANAANTIVNRYGSGTTGATVEGPVDFSGASVELPQAASEGTCDASTRGRVSVTTGTTGVADQVVVCVKNESDGYEWVLVGVGGP